MKKLLLPFALLFAQCGKYTTTNPTTLQGLHDTVISGLLISNRSGDCLHLVNCKNVKIINSRFGPATGVGIQLDSCVNVTIKRCFFNSASTGICAIGSTGIDVDSNQIMNVYRRFFNSPHTGLNLGNDTLRYKDGGQAVQFDGVYGANNKIYNNKIENFPGVSDPEDAISILRSSGTLLIPIVVQGNWIRGGGPSICGGGIMTGDEGGSFVIVKNNILLNPGQYGIAIAGGHDIKLLNNIVVAKKGPINNVGCYVWNQTPDHACANNTVSGNQINYINKDGVSNPNWNSGNCGSVAGWSTNNWVSRKDSTVLPVKVITCY